MQCSEPRAGRAKSPVPDNHTQITQQKTVIALVITEYRIKVRRVSRCLQLRLGYLTYVLVGSIPGSIGAAAKQGNFSERCHVLVDLQLILQQCR